MKKYYLNGKNTENDILSIEDIRIKGLELSDYVWFEGLDDWKPITEIEELQSFIKKTVVPPPFQPKPVTPPAYLPKEESKQSTGSQLINDKYFGYQLARRRDRFWADLVFTIFTMLIYFVYRMIANGTTSLSQLPTESYSENLIFTTILTGIFGAIFYPIWSGNLGHKLMGLKVISVKGGTDFNIGKMGMLREGLKSVFGIFFLPVIWLLWDKDKQNLYDKVCETYVVKVKK